jgi:hypothetical protein
VTVGVVNNGYKSETRVPLSLCLQWPTSPQRKNHAHKGRTTRPTTTPRPPVVRQGQPGRSEPMLLVVLVVVAAPGEEARPACPMALACSSTSSIQRRFWRPRRACRGRPRSRSSRQRRRRYDQWRRGWMGWWRANAIRRCAHFAVVE